MYSPINLTPSPKTKAIPKSTRGQSLVELALMLVFILVLLAGAVDLGRMMYEYQTMRDAAQEGAGYGSIYPGYCEEIANRVFQNLPDNHYSVIVRINGLSCEGARTIDASTTLPTNGCASKEIIVSLDHDFDVTMPLLSAFTGPTVPMHVDIRDRIVRPECD